MSNQKLLTPQELTQRWCDVVTTGTLANWRCKGVGPAYMKLRGRIFYPVAAICLLAFQPLLAGASKL